jgi:hypothetical protein
MDKKELKKQYKHTLRPMGIFQIKNLVNEKIFIGSSSNVEGKLNSIKFQLEMDSYVNKELQKDFTKFGGNKFIFETIDILEPKQDPGYDYSEDLKTLEDMWLEKLKPFNEKGYNKRKD